MTTEKTVDDVVKLVELTLSLQNVQLETQMGKIRGWDSMRHLRLMMAIEKGFQVKIPNSQLGRLTSVQLIVDYLRSMNAIAVSSGSEKKV